MPWIGIYDGRKRAPRQVPIKVDAECPECGGTLRVRRKSSDGRARHFVHKKNLGGGGGGGGVSCESVGESDLHLKWKSLAADKLEELFEGNIRFCEMEKAIAAPHTDQERRIADALVLFDEPDDVLGQGIAIEVQHKNTSKDIYGTTRDYIEQNISVAWLVEDDFADDRCRMQEVDIRNRARDAVWPEHAPDKQISAQELEYRTERKELLNELGKEIPARLPGEYFDDQARSIWESTDWENLFCNDHVFGACSFGELDDPTGEKGYAFTAKVYLKTWLDSDGQYLAKQSWGNRTAHYLATIKGTTDRATYQGSLVPRRIFDEIPEQDLGSKDERVVKPRNRRTVTSTKGFEHNPGRTCPNCDRDKVVSQREAEMVFNHRTSASYVCSWCHI